MDGHHRYIAAKLSKTEIQIFPSTKNHSQQTFEWCDIILKTNEYDSESEIKYHNFNDALRNGISVDQIEKFWANMKKWIKEKTPEFTTIGKTISEFFLVPNFN